MRQRGAEDMIDVCSSHNPATIRFFHAHQRGASSNLYGRGHTCYERSSKCQGLPIRAGAILQAV